MESEILARIKLGAAHLAGRIATRLAEGAMETAPCRKDIYSQARWEANFYASVREDAAWAVAEERAANARSLIVPLP